MSAMPSSIPPLAGGGSPGAGTVESVDGDRLWLRLAAARTQQSVAARWVALPGWSPGPGDEVLVLGDGNGEWFVAGPLSAGPAAAPERLDLPGGGAAELDPDSGTLQVQDGGGTVLFSYRCAEGIGSLRLQAGEVELAATRGDLRLSAAGSVEARGRCVALAGERSVAAAVVGPPGEASSRLELERDTVRLETGDLEARAERLRGRVERADWAGTTWNLRVNRMVFAARRLETRAETLVENLGSAYRRVRDLSQLSTRRLRHLVEETVQTRARRVLYRASEAFKVRGDKIHLG